jgi:hypothetical protein
VSDQFDDARLRALYGAGAGDAPDTPHPTPEALAAAAERRGPEADRLRTLDHITTCAQCRRDFDVLWATERAGRQLVASQSRTRMLAAAAVVLIAAAATLVSLPRLRHASPSAAPGDSTESAERGAGTVATPIVVIAPRGIVGAGAPRVLVWHAVPGAPRYDVEVLDDSGSVVFRTSTADTVVGWPTLGAGRTYRWWVRANTTDAGWRSALIAFRTPSP